MEMDTIICTHANPIEINLIIPLIFSFPFPLHTKQLLLHTLGPLGKAEALRSYPLGVGAI